jgi:hypothetical protein
MEIIYNSGSINQYFLFEWIIFFIATILKGSHLPVVVVDVAAIFEYVVVLEAWYGDYILIIFWVLLINYFSGSIIDVILTLFM